MNSCTDLEALSSCRLPRHEGDMVEAQPKASCAYERTGGVSEATRL